MIPTSVFIASSLRRNTFTGKPFGIFNLYSYTCLRFTTLASINRKRLNKENRDARNNSKTNCNRIGKGEQTREGFNKNLDEEVGKVIC